jgi:hypothetical protein
MTGQFLMAGKAGIIGIAARKFDGYNIQRSVVMLAPGLPVNQLSFQLQG